MKILIPMAGLGSRFKVCAYEKPKPLIEVDGVPMIERSISTLNIDGDYVFVIRAYDNDQNTKDLVECLQRIKPECQIILTDTVTSGAAETCLLAKNHINNNEKLIIANCDQLMDWNSENFIKETQKNFDGLVVTHTDTDPKNSFILYL